MTRAIPKQQKDQLGRRLCRNCQAVITSKRMRSYCSRECREKFSIAYFATSARYHVYKRDSGVCAKCGCDTGKIERILRECRAWMRWAEVRSVSCELGFRGKTQRLWDADHVLECVRGGWGKGLDNFRTLCIPCHKSETARLAAERAEERKMRDSLFSDVQKEQPDYSLRLT